ncbi:MAG: hypothetical protein ABS80_19850 [Pseudonocardia sp. SCN 72-51]|nr:MAG: hypothetical protein ABS80_19850 [Pseudonocardia sp. SCN 72-51]
MLKARPAGPAGATGAAGAVVVRGRVVGGADVAALAGGAVDGTDLALVDVVGAVVNDVVDGTAVSGRAWEPHAAVTDTAVTRAAASTMSRAAVGPAR